jgi:arabinofuranan 3-O-arabinosyltransferase
MNTSPCATVIVTTKNSERTIEACLRSIINQQPLKPELIVVDNSSTDATPEIANSFADKFFTCGPERSAQRNLGIREAQSQYVLIIDADMVLNPDVVQACLLAIDGAKGVAIPEESFGSGFWTKCKVKERSYYSNDSLVSACRFYRKADVLALGGFDEDLTGAEDWDLSMRVCGEEGPVFADEVIRHDEGEHSLGELFRRKFYYGRGFRKFIKKHGGKALKKISPNRPSLLNNAGSLAKEPVIAFGVVLVKSVEFAGAVFGMLSASDPKPTSFYKDR